jgi:uncharacterized membrane protein YsdA (DUF1294 family)
MRDLFYPVIYILLINVWGFSLVGWDKSKARKGRWRVPERRFFLLAAVGAAGGVYLGMLFFRHKTRHWQFTVGIPLLIILNIACGYLIFYFRLAGN